MCVRPDGASLVFLEVGVVSQAAKGLDGEEADYEKTKDWVGAAELCAGEGCFSLTYKKI